MTSSHNTVSAINAFSDNYIWAIGSNNNDFITLVDPGDAKVCIDFIEKNNIKSSYSKKQQIRLKM